MLLEAVKETELTGHDVQASEPGAVLYVPALHGWQKSRADPWNPGLQRQSSLRKLPTAESESGKQKLQASDPAALLHFPATYLSHGPHMLGPVYLALHKHDVRKLSNGLSAWRGQSELDSHDPVSGPMNPSLHLQSDMLRLP